MSKKKDTKAKSQSEEPKRIFKETIDIEVEKTPAEIKESQEVLRSLVMKKYDLEQSIEKAKVQLSNMKNDLRAATQDVDSTTKDVEVEAIVKIYADCKKEIYVDGKLHKTEQASKWELQTDVDDLNYDPESEEEEESDDDDN